MLYTCSCGFSCGTATAFYKHLANSKDAANGIVHQLQQAKPATRSSTAGDKKEQVSSLLLRQKSATGRGGGTGQEAATTTAAATTTTAVPAAAAAGGGSGNGAGTPKPAGRSTWQGLLQGGTRSPSAATQQPDWLSDYLRDPITATSPDQHPPAAAAAAAAAASPAATAAATSRAAAATATAAATSPAPAPAATAAIGGGINGWEQPLSPPAPISTYAPLSGMLPPYLSPSSPLSPGRPGPNQPQPNNPPPAHVTTRHAHDIPLSAAAAAVNSNSNVVSRRPAGPPAVRTSVPPVVDQEEIHLDFCNHHNHQRPAADRMLAPPASGATGLGNLLNLMTLGLTPLKAVWGAATYVTGGAAADAQAMGLGHDRGLQEEGEGLDNNTLSGRSLQVPSPSFALSPSHHQHLQHYPHETLLTASPPGPGAVSQSVAAVEALLLWHEPWVTGRVLLGGLYAILCAKQLMAGSSLLATSTALLGLAFLLLLTNLARLAWWTIGGHKHATTAARPGTQPAAGSGGGEGGEEVGYGGIAGVGGGKASGPGSWGGAAAGAWRASLSGGRRSACGGPPSPSMQRAMDEEARVFAVTHMVLARIALVLVPTLAGAAALVYRALSGRRLASSALAAGCLWLGMLLGELRVVGQPAFAALCWVAAFTVPCAYVRSRSVADHMVEDVLRFLVKLMVHSERYMLLAAMAVFGGFLAWAPMASWVLRATVALTAGFAVLLYGRLSQASRVAGGGLDGGRHNAVEGADEVAGGRWGEDEVVRDAGFGMNGGLRQRAGPLPVSVGAGS